MAPPKRWVIDTLDDKLLLKNGNYLYKIAHEDQWYVLKVYYGSRSQWVRFTKSFNNVVLLGQTSYWPKTRLRIERECLELWTKHGFRTFDFYPDIEVVAPNLPPQGYLLFGYVEAPTLEEILVDYDRPIEERMDLYRRWVLEWCRRHDIAEKEKEPKLQHENGDFGHIFVMENDEFLWFDLEMVYTSKEHIKEHLWHEIIQYMWYMLRKVTPELQERILEETVRHYPNRERLADAPRLFLDHPRLLMRMGRKIDSWRRKGRKPTSKYNVSRRLREKIEAMKGELG